MSESFDVLVCSHIRQAQEAVSSEDQFHEFVVELDVLGLDIDL